MNLNKSGKSAYFRHFFANSTDLKSAWSSAFYDTHIEFLRITFFLLLLAFFLNFDCKCEGDSSKNGNFFL